MKENLTYNPKPTYTVEKLNIMFSEIFIKYADQEDDDPRNIENKTDFTSFSWNIHNKDFILDDQIKKEIQEDVSKLISLEINYKLNLKNSFSIPEIIIEKIEKIFNTIKQIYPEVKI